MLTTYILKLKNEFLKQEVIANRKSLQTGEWKKGSYNQLSKLIQSKLDNDFNDEQKTELGITISPRTLYNIFEFKRKINLPLDRRALATLNKMVFFAGYNSWDEFALKIDQQNSTGSKSKK